jgi:integrase/recombinase XerD
MLTDSFSTVSRDDQDLMTLWLSGRPETTRRAYLAEAKALLGSLPNGLTGATQVEIVTYLSNHSGSAPASRARRISAIKSLLRFAARMGHTTTDLGTVLKIPRVTNRLHERILDQEEVADLIKEASNGRDRTLMKFLYISACRISEAVGIRWVDLGPTGVTVIGKGSKIRTVALPKDILDELRRLRGASDRDEAHVFRSCRGGKLSVRQARDIVSTAAAEALDKKVSPHWLRHAHASHALSAGAPLHLVKATLGHSSLASTAIYLSVRPDVGSGMYLKTGS